MPGIDGNEATRRLRATVRHARTPIAALSAGVFDDERLSALAAGADVYLVKPLRLEPLLEFLREA